MIRLLAGMPVSSTCVEAKQRAASERAPALDNPDGAAQCGARSRRRRSRTRAVEGSLRVDDIVIRGGQVVDGSGAPGRVADVVIRDGRVAAIEPGHFGPARRVIDARGRVVSPGFVDVKTHSDWTLPLNPRAESKVRQGVTTRSEEHTSELQSRLHLGCRLLLEKKKIKQLTVYQPSIRDAYTQNFFLSVQQRVTDSVGIQANMLDAVRRKLITTDRFNRPNSSTA